MKKFISLIITLFILIITITLSQSESFTSIKNDINALCSKEFKGRGLNTDGHILAAEYIAKRFEEIGLKNISDDYLQELPAKLNMQTDEATLIINGKELELGREFIPHHCSGSGDDEASENIINNFDGIYIDSVYNPYAEQDYSSKVLVIEHKVSNELMEKYRTDYPEAFDFRRRIMVAAAIGPKAIIIKSKSLVYGSPREAYPCPVFVVVDSICDKKIESISYYAETEFGEVESQNVIGFLEGKKHKDSTIIICAHYDQCGELSDEKYFPGANDNASGTSLMINLAEYFKKNPIDYSIVFVAFTAEELGLIGASYFANNSPVDLKKCRFLLNLDMLASGNDGIMAVGGVDFPEDFELLQKCGEKAGVKEIKKRKSVPNGDHYPFFDKGVKSFFLYTYNGKQPYHHVDDVPETLDWEALEKAFSLTKYFIEGLK